MPTDILGHIFTAIKVVNFRPFDKPEKRFHFFYFAINVSLILIIYAGTSPAIGCWENNVKHQ